MPDCESSGAGSSGSGCRPRTRQCICCPGRAAGTKSRLREDEGWRTAGGDSDSSHHREGLVTERLSLRLQLHLHHEGSAARDLCTTTPSETRSAPGGGGPHQRTCDCRYRASRTAWPPDLLWGTYSLFLLAPPPPLCLPPSSSLFFCRSQRTDDECSLKRFRCF